MEGRRPSATRSTLSLYIHRATRYQKFLNLASLFLLLMSTILIFTAAILIKFYHMTKLAFWSQYFWIVPIIMLTLGIYTFCVCVYSFAISGTENRILIILYTILVAIAFVIQLVSIFTALELRTRVAQKNLGISGVHRELEKYSNDSYIRAKWDTLQIDLQCCGGNGFSKGYQDYYNTPMGFQNKSVPDSCCHQYQEGCGRGILNKIDTQMPKFIFVDGCLEILRTKLENDVIPMMVVYACVGVILAIAEIISVVLACAYVAQIKRRRVRENGIWMRTNINEPLDSDPLNHETEC